ncbi:ATP dependent DNA ligase domain-containing protein [Paenibacillaceae bacterium GAS479]|nr:ATP dependent DNA ligase domain-containing protein [Paenibacillaceae bacterium GAS479]
MGIKTLFMPEGMVAPMAPISAAKLPSGEEWGYQIKWDGVRLLAQIGVDKSVQLISRQGLLKNTIYPELVSLLQGCASLLGPCVLDGELISWTGERPSFQRVLQRERTRGYGGSSSMTELSHPDPGIAPWRSSGVAESLRSTSAATTVSQESTGADASLRSTGADASLRSAGDGASLRSTGVAASLRSTGVAASLRSAGAGASLRSLGADATQRSRALASASDDTSRLPDRSADANPLPQAVDGIFPSPPGLVFVLFDLLEVGGRDLRQLPYRERHETLLQLAPLLPSGLLITELYSDGEALWRWVSNAGWEGVVSKRLTAPYREAKKHRDWLKTKTALLIDVNIVGLKVREGQAVSLIMSLDGQYFGSVSLGLTGEMRALLTSQLVPGNAFADRRSQYGNLPFPTLHPDLKGEKIVWLEQPIPCTVTGLEITEAGQLRHPKLASFGRRG